MEHFEHNNQNPKCTKLVNRLISSGQKTNEFFQNIHGEQWYSQIYSEGETWSVQHILAHFVSSEAAVTRLIKMILQGYEGAPVDFDIDAYNQREVNCLTKLPNSLILERFMIRRGETIQMVQGIKDADLVREGRHPWLGMTSIEDMIKLIYRHTQIHQRDIRKTLIS
jgi:hypothetical protein